MRRLLARLKGVFRRPWLLLGVLAVLGGAAAVAAPHVGAWLHLRAGRTALERYHIQEARTHLDACLAVWPNNAEARLLAARAARRGGDLEAAEHHLRECQRHQDTPSDAVVLESALLRASAGRPEEVEKWLRDRAARSPAEAPLVWEALAEGYLRMYRILDAVSCLNNWLEQQPDNPQALLLRGNVWLQAGASSKAAEDYSRVVELDPSRDEARRPLARCLLKVGRYAEALAHLERLRRRSDDPDLGVDLARCHFELGRRAEASELLDAILVRHPGDGPALRERGRLALLAGKPAAAEGWLTPAVRAMPADHQARYLLQEALRRQGKTAAADAEAARAKKLQASSERLGEVKRQMSARPYDPALHCEMGTLLLSQGYKEMGRRWLLSALQRDAHYKPAHAALADYYKEQGDEQDAAMHRAQAGP